MLERAKFLTEVMKVLWATAGGSFAVALTADRVTVFVVGKEIVMWTALAFAAVLAIIAGSVGVVALKIIWEETARPR
jgi:hypothetical protein